MLVAEGAQTQTAFIIIDSTSGERTIIWNKDEMTSLQPGEVDRGIVQSARALLIDGHDASAATTAAKYAHDAGIPVVLDIDNIYPGADEMLRQVDFLISSSTFPEKLVGEKDLHKALRILHEKYGSLLVGATLGVDGVLAYIHGKYIYSPAFAVECMDTTGAGDAFHGGFIYGLLAGLSIEETLRFANAVAGLNCRDIGARTGLPDLVTVSSFLSSNPATHSSS
jgi:sulfofructose kinase